MPEDKTSLTVSNTIVNQLRIEKGKLIAATGEFWSYETMLEALLAHWQTNPPAALPQRHEVAHNYQVAPA